MRHRFGTIRGLQECASPRGTFTMLALDHRQNLRRELRPDDPGSVTTDEMVAFKRAVVRAIGGAGTGVLLDPEIGAAHCIADGSLPAGVGLVVALEATGYLGASTARISRMLEGWSAERVRNLGASAAKLLVYYHPDASNAATQERFVAEVAAACRALDLALFLEPLSFSLRDGVRLSGPERRRVVLETARRLTPLGGDVLKAEFPYDAGETDEDRWRDACEELTAAIEVPWVLLSGGVDAATFEAQVRVACAAGASGVLAGRSIWAESATMAPPERDAFLIDTAHGRLRGLAAIVDELARPWMEAAPSLRESEPVPEGWYRA
jgi:tagatose-1,6-bisphosphate aldolase